MINLFSLTDKIGQLHFEEFLLLAKRFVSGVRKTIKNHIYRFRMKQNVPNGPRYLLNCQTSMVMRDRIFLITKKSWELLLVKK